MTQPIRNYKRKLNNLGNNYANHYYVNENDATRTVYSPVNERNKYMQYKPTMLGKAARFAGQIYNELQHPYVDSDSLAVQRRVDEYNRRVFDSNKRYSKYRYNKLNSGSKPSKVIRVEGIGGRALYKPDENYPRSQGGSPFDSPISPMPVGAYNNLPKLLKWTVPFFKDGGEVRSYDSPRQYGTGGIVRKVGTKILENEVEKTAAKAAKKTAVKGAVKAGAKAGVKKAAKTTATSIGQAQRGAVTSIRRTKKPVELNLFESSAQTARTTAKSTVKAGTKRAAKSTAKSTRKATAKSTPNLPSVQYPQHSGLRSMQNVINNPQYKLPSIQELMERSMGKSPLRLPRKKYVKPSIEIKSNAVEPKPVTSPKPKIVEPYDTPEFRQKAESMARQRGKQTGINGLYRKGKAATLSAWRKGRDYLAKRKAERAAARAAQNPVEAAPQNATAAAEQVKPGFWTRRKAARAAKREERLAKDELRSRAETPFGFRQMWRGRPVYKDEKFVGRSKISGKNILMYGVPTGIGATMAIKGINRYIDKSPSYTPKSNIDQRNQTQQIRQISEVPNSSQNTEYIPEDTITNAAPQDTTAAVREEVVEQAPQREENSNNNVEQTNNSNNNVEQTNNSKTAPVNNNATVRNARAATRQNRRRNRMTNNYNAARRLKASLSFNPSSDEDLLYMNEADQRYQAAKNYLDSKDNPSDEDIKFATEVSPELKQEMDNEAAVRRQEATDEMINALDEERRRRGESFRFGGKIYKRR